MRPHKALGHRSLQAKQLSQPAGGLPLPRNEPPCSGTPQAGTAEGVPAGLQWASLLLFAP